MRVRPRRRVDVRGESARSPAGLRLFGCLALTSD
jgi:hypothetical protein